MTNNRRNPRVYCGASGSLEGPRGPVRGRARNISQGGAFFQTGELLPIGKTFELSILLPEGPVTGMAEIRYHHRYVDGEGMGVRFVRVDEEGMRRLGAFIDAHR